MPAKVPMIVRTLDSLSGEKRVHIRPKRAIGKSRVPPDHARGGIQAGFKAGFDEAIPPFGTPLRHLARDRSFGYTPGHPDRL